MQLIIGRGESKRDRGHFVPWRQVNMLLEKTPTDPDGYNLLSIPPLAEQYDRGVGPINGIFWKSGLFGGSLFVVSGSTVYRDGTSLGTINGTGPVWWAAGIGELCVGRGQSAYSYNGTNLAAITFPDSADVRSGNYMGRRFVFVRKGSGRFYWSAVDNGRTIDGLNYATAENEPDDLLEIRKIGDAFLLMGQNSIETWVLTGDVDLPWTPVVRSAITTRGLQDNGCAQEIEGTVYFIASDGMVCSWTGGTAARISESGLEERIRKSTTGTTFSFTYEGKPMFVMRIDEGTFGLDLATGNMPVQFQTQGRTQWAAKCAVNVGSEPLFGDDSDGKVWRFDPDSTTDAGNDEFPRIFSAGLPLNQQPLAIYNVLVDGNSGDTEAVSGDAADPVIEMRTSRDGGRTFGQWRAAKWGAMGEYKRKARFGTTGMFHPPGFYAEYRFLPVLALRIEGVRANEALSGRGR